MKNNTNSTATIGQIFSCVCFICGKEATGIDHYGNTWCDKCVRNNCNKNQLLEALILAIQTKVVKQDVKQIYYFGETYLSADSFIDLLKSYKDK